MQHNFCFFFRCRTQDCSTTSPKQPLLTSASCLDTVVQCHPTGGAPRCRYIHHHPCIHRGTVLSSLYRTNYDTIPTRRAFDGVVANRLNPKAAHSRHVRVDLRRPFRILCLDGGGVRGALTTAIISRICDHNPRFLDNIDFICGTSAGGILALLLACGYSAKECEDIYSFAAPHIFPHNPWRVINPFRSKYSDKAKQEILQHYYGDRTMKDLSKTCAVIAFRLDGRKSKTHAMFNIEGWRPAVFSNMPRASGLIEPDSDLQIWDAAMRTSAAPTFFPVFRGYTDGGIVANNPSIIALSKAMAHYPHVNPKNVTLLSIGAGNYPRHTHMLNNLDSNTTSTHDEEEGSRGTYNTISLIIHPDASLLIQSLFGARTGDTSSGSRTCWTSCSRAGPSRTTWCFTTCSTPRTPAACTTASTLNCLGQLLSMTWDP